jgi:hypothetical protein
MGHLHITCKYLTANRLEAFMQKQSYISLKEAVMEGDGPHVRSDIEGVEAVPHGAGSSDKNTWGVRHTSADALHTADNGRADGWAPHIGDGRLACRPKMMDASGQHLVYAPTHTHWVQLIA